MYFPRKYGGYGVINLHAKMTEVQGQFMVQHIRNGDYIGKRTRIHLEVLQLESGKQKSILDMGGRPR